MNTNMHGQLWFPFRQGFSSDDDNHEILGRDITLHSTAPLKVQQEKTCPQKETASRFFLIAPVAEASRTKVSRRMSMQNSLRVAFSVWNMEA